MRRLRRSDASVVQYGIQPVNFKSVNIIKDMMQADYRPKCNVATFVQYLRLKW